MARDTQASGGDVDRDSVQQSLHARAEEKIRQETGAEPINMERGSEGMNMAKGSEGARLQSAAEQYDRARKGMQKAGGQDGDPEDKWM